MLKYLCLAGLLLATVAVNAAPIEDSTEVLEEFEHYIDSVKTAQHYETGVIHLPGGKAEIKVPAGFKFLNKEQSISVLTKVWGNPPATAENTLGMIFPENDDPFSENSYAFIVKYEDIGYVKDDDAEKIDYDEMLKNMQKEEKENNEERVKAGYSTIHMVGWAQKPFYDKEKKVLHWAKELKFGDQEGANTLNYEIRILGRHGILSLNAVCTMKELALVKANIDKVLPMASFTDGNTYFDFDPKIDNVAAWTIGGLVAGKVLAKVGFFAIILKYLGVLWKFILLGLAALAGVFKKLFNRKKETTTYESSEAVAADAMEEVPAIEAAAPQAENNTDEDTKPVV
ncbi:MAG TPA: DUF2167 domain-containing protein [Chitinophaga sp.]